MSELVSPFALDGEDSIAPEVEDNDIDLSEITELLQKASIAKKEADIAKARYDVLRERIGVFLRQIGEDKIETDFCKASIRENKSDYTYSDKVKEAEKQLKLMQEIEKRHGLAVPQKITRSVVFTTK